MEDPITKIIAKVVSDTLTLVAKVVSDVDKYTADELAQKSVELTEWAVNAIKRLEK